MKDSLVMLMPTMLGNLPEAMEQDKMPLMALALQDLNTEELGQLHEALCSVLGLMHTGWSQEKGESFSLAMFEINKTKGFVLSFGAKNFDIPDEQLSAIAGKINSELRAVIDSYTEEQE